MSEGYQSISQEGAVQEEPMEISSSDLHNNAAPSTPSRLLLILLALSSLLAYGAGRAASRWAAPSESVRAPGRTQLCRTRVPVKVLQSSRAEPSRHWDEVACLPAELSQSVSPSAQIHLEFSRVPFADRQPILGFGGAFTEAAARNYKSLSAEGQKAVMDLLFGREGLGYSLGRTHINSCDFSVESYSFDDAPDDFELQHFDHHVTHDSQTGMLDMMILADQTLRQSYPREPKGMRIIASPWSPPSWMKAPIDENDIGHATNMTGSVQPVCLREGVGKDSPYAKSWALYFAKFIDAYQTHGITLFGVSVQNEPEFPAPWEACAYDPLSERDFIANHLGPQLATSHPDIKILFFDHNKDHIVNWARQLLDSNSPAAKYIHGTAFHWYAGGMDRLLDGAQGTPNLHRMISALEEMNVDKGHILLGSEGCHCPTTGYAGGNLDIAWARAARNAHAILADLAAGSNGFIEWNMILDSIGGPNHLGNLCDSPLLAVPHRAANAKGIPEQLDFEHAGHPFGRVHGDGKTREELHAEGVPVTYLDLGIVVQPMYYYVGHVTKFVRPGSYAVHALVDSSMGGPEERTFRPNGQTVAGGGINDLARVGIEVTVWPCEGSTRQEWKINSDNQLQVFGHDWLGEPTTSCLSKEADKDMGGLVLTTCNITEDKSGIFDVQPMEGKPDRVNIFLTSGKMDLSLNCLIVQPLGNSGGAYGPRGGAQVTIGNCSDPMAEWTLSEVTGEISSMAFPGGEVCMTTGWPFLQVGAFDTSATGDNAKTVVVLNEAGETANFELKLLTSGETILSSSIPPHSIQTILYD